MFSSVLADLASSIIVIVIITIVNMLFIFVFVRSVKNFSQDASLLTVKWAGWAVTTWRSLLCVFYKEELTKNCARSAQDQVTLVHLTAIIHHHFILDSEVLGVDSFSFYWRCDHFNVQTSMTIKTEACFRMEASERKRVRIAETENIDKFFIGFNCPRNTNKNVTRKCSTFSRVHCTEVEF